MSQFEESWVLIKPDAYLAVPIKSFVELMSTAKNVRKEWLGSKTTYSESSEAMEMVVLSGDQMTAMLVRDRVTQSSAPSQ